MNDSINLEQNALLTQKAHEILSQRFNLKTSIKQLDKSSLIQVGEHYLALIHNGKVYCRSSEKQSIWCNEEPIHSFESSRTHLKAYREVDFDIFKTVDFYESNLLPTYKEIRYKRSIRLGLPVNDRIKVKGGIKTLLSDIGINTKTDLIQRGVVSTYIEMRKNTTKELQDSMLYTLQGAIDEVPVPMVKNEKRKELLAEYRLLSMNSVGQNINREDVRIMSNLGRIEILKQVEHKLLQSPNLEDMYTDAILGRSEQSWQVVEFILGVLEDKYTKAHSAEYAGEILLAVKASKAIDYFLNVGLCQQVGSPLTQKHIKAYEAGYIKGMVAPLSIMPAFEKMKMLQERDTGLWDYVQNRFIEEVENARTEQALLNMYRATLLKIINSKSTPKKIINCIHLALATPSSQVA
ncbi:TfoX/Sxy family DNA transformation protein [Vibrio harveyi]|uniref:TfoX/Sxy family DNA transformation protein n=1 Tax=Vibrio harveyi TaxID=669 RepID=UPI0031C40E89